MLSYNWNHPGIVLAARQMLEANAIPCWIDVDHMGVGCTVKM